VPNVINIISGALPADPWRSRPGAFNPRPSFPGTGVPGIGSGTGPCAAAARPVMRVRHKVALTVPVTQLGQTNNNHMTSVVAVGEGASGPPLCREPA
jgi:hypothetical protein